MYILNIGMSLYEQMTIVPIYSSILLMVGILSGLVILDEMKFYTTKKLIGIFIGAIISCIGILVILRKNRLEKNVTEIEPKVRI